MRRNLPPTGARFLALAHAFRAADTGGKESLRLINNPAQ
jgi:hypothetical protein